MSRGCTILYVQNYTLSNNIIGIPSHCRASDRGRAERPGGGDHWREGEAEVKVQGHSWSFWFLVHLPV